MATGFSPIIGRGEADLIVAFENGSTALDRVSETGREDCDQRCGDPFGSHPNELASYPEGIIEELSQKATTYVFKATELAEELGNPKSMNMILLGALVKAIGLPQINWEEIIKRNIKPAFLDINLKAFQVGQAQVAD